tara:strand:+ start:1170 stop:1310 length:141 start_codon:yes stop_codon:yes gene_type:complete
LIFWNFIWVIVPIALITALFFPTFHRLTNEKYLQPTEKLEEVIKED